MKRQSGAHGYGRPPVAEAGGQLPQLVREHFGRVGAVERRASLVVLCLVFLGAGDVACVAVRQTDRECAVDAVRRAREQGFPDQRADLGRRLYRHRADQDITQPVHAELKNLR